MHSETVQIYSIGDIKSDLASVARLFTSSDTLGGINSRHIKFLESKFEQITDKKSIFVNSCTNGLYLALRSLNLKNEHVAVSPITFFGIISAIIMAGGIPVYTAVDNYGLMDTDSVHELRKKYNIRAVIPSHINNRYVDVSDLSDSVVIEDAAPAFGVRRTDDTSVLRTINTAVISFSYGKPLSAGEGGMIILNNTDDFEWYYQQRFCGLSINGVYGYDSFNVLSPELKLVSTALGAALVNIKLKSFEDKMLLSKKIAQYYTSIFGHLIDSQLYENGNHQTFVLLSKNRDTIMQRLNKVGVKSYLSHRPAYYNTAFANYNGATNYKTSSESYYSKVLHIPCRYDLSDEQVMLIAETVKNAL